MTKKKFVDPKQYCKYLINPPVLNEEEEYQTGKAETLYNCALNRKPCVARYIEDRTTSK